MSALTAYWEGHLSPQEAVRLLEPTKPDPDPQPETFERQAFILGLVTGIGGTYIGVALGLLIF